MERVPLDNTEFEGENVAYLFDGERTVLVDTGLAIPEVRDQLRSGLADRGLAVADLDALLLTHWHADHAGLAGELQADSGATVRAHAGDAGLVAGDESARQDLLEARDRQLDAWHVPEEPRAELEAFLAAHEDAESGERADVTPIGDGETVRAGDEQLTAIATPGHTVGHIAYARDDGSVLTGDALLPEYTPNVGGSDPRVEAPLTTYLETLRRLVAGDYDRAYPGHRSPIADPTARAEEILTHHRQRSRRVVSVLRERGPLDVWSVSDALFGDLSGIHIIHGPGEAHAHLQHMSRHGLVERTDDGYVVVDGADPDRAFE